MDFKVCASFFTLNSLKLERSTKCGGVSCIDDIDDIHASVSIAAFLRMVTDDSVQGKNVHNITCFERYIIARFMEIYLLFKLVFTVLAHS
jgi:hypothetical protein